MADEAISYDKADLRKILGAFKAMDEQAIAEAKKAGGALAEFLRGKVVEKAYTRTKAGQVAVRIAEGSKVAKSSKIGEISIGFASQKFSGGGTTQQLWGGMEFGSKTRRQFPFYNKKGYFIYPALRENQKELVAQWEDAFSRIVKEYD